MADQSAKKSVQKAQQARQQVYAGFIAHGPCTIYELSQKLQLPLMEVQARTGQLIKLMRVAKHSRSADSRRVLYEAIPD